MERKRKERRKEGRRKLMERKRKERRKEGKS